MASSFEGGQALDSVLVSPSTFFASLSELSTGTETVSAKQVFIVRVDQGASGHDTVATKVRFRGSVQESIGQLTDTVRAGASFVALINELGIPQDSAAADFLWKIINDSQSVAWQNIASPEGATWGVIATDTGASWQVINTGAGTQWANIGTDANPVWVLIKTSP